MIQTTDRHCIHPAESGDHSVHCAESDEHFIMRIQVSISFTLDPSLESFHVFPLRAQTTLQ